MAGWRFPGGWWLSLVLVSVVPVWFYLAGWNGGQGVKRELAGTARVGDSAFQLWKQSYDDGRVRWCAQPLSRGVSGVFPVFKFRSATLETEFDSGLACATTEGSDPRMPMRAFPQKRSN